tara:strand:+ start:7222 stop:7476 length:255 start_codon:yes stop_codon:yes gene_type:complete
VSGLNDYASFDNVIIFGRAQPAASGMSDQARAMWWDAEVRCGCYRTRLAVSATRVKQGAAGAFKEVFCGFKFTLTGESTAFAII